MATHSSNMPTTPDQGPPARLSIREVHQVVLKVIELAALREGAGVAEGSPAMRKIDQALTTVRDSLWNVADELPLTVEVARDGSARASFSERTFGFVDAYEALSALCREQRRLIRRDRRDRERGKEADPRYTRRAFALRLAEAMRPLMKLEHALAMRVTKKAEALLAVDEVKLRPSEVAGIILEDCGFSKERSAQAMKKMRPRAIAARLRRPRGLEIAIQEFLTCIQVPRELVVPWSNALLLGQVPGAELQVDLSKSGHELGRRARPVLRRRAHYSLADARPALGIPGVPATDSGQTE